MFKELGAMMNLLKNQGKIQEEIQKFQARWARSRPRPAAGAGYVAVKVNGRMEVLSVRISEEAMKLNDREMLEDLIAAATNQALAKVRQLLPKKARRWPPTSACRLACSVAAGCPEWAERRSRRRDGSGFVEQEAGPCRNRAE